MLKPNIGRSVQPGTGITTHPQVVAAAIDAFREAGADVAVGESPITGVTMLNAFESSGITAIAKTRNCPLVDMDVRRYFSCYGPNRVLLTFLTLRSSILVVLNTAFV